MPARSRARDAPLRVNGVIRPYVPADEGALHTLAADTAYYGAPVEHMMEDRRVFIHAFVRPYTAHHAHTCWVAEADGEVVGYLTGCMDTRAQQAALRRAAAGVMARALALRYRLGPKAVRTGVAFVRHALAGGEPAIDLDAYPAHLHINVAAAYRGRGLGQGLMRAFIDQCRRAGLPGIHLTTSERNTAAVFLYQKLGFCELARYPSRFHSGVSRRPVMGLIFGLALRGEG